MKRLLIKICLFNSLLIFWSDEKGQNNLPPVYEITTDTILHYTLPNFYWQKSINDKIFQPFFTSKPNRAGNRIRFEFEL